MGKNKKAARFLQRKMGGFPDIAARRLKTWFW
jgi:hypothetical protein